MKFSTHARIRMGQRGITDRLVRLAQRHGRVDGDACILNVKELRAVLDDLDAERRTVMKAMDKGGLVVVEEDDTVVTTYNITERLRR
jgi:hypothetical protein